MESFEHVTRVWMETQGYVVSSGVKFPVRLRTKKKAQEEYQVHGYEIDLVGARRNKLILVNVKSYFGSHGLTLERLEKEKLFGNSIVLDGVLEGAMNRYGFKKNLIELWVVAGKVTSGRRTKIESFLKHFAASHRLKTKLITVETIAEGLASQATKKMYINDPVIATVKCLHAAKLLPAHRD